MLFVTVCDDLLLASDTVCGVQISASKHFNTPFRSCFTKLGEISNNKWTFLSNYSILISRKVTLGTSQSTLISSNSTI
jgi:hypothetical protein